MTKYSVIPWILLLFLLISACAPQETPDTVPQTVPQTAPHDPTQAVTDPTDTVPPPTTPTDPTGAAETLPFEPGEPSKPTAPAPDNPAGDAVTVYAKGKCRIPYTVRISAVHYFTSPDQLPDCPELEDYDADWFRDHALVVVYETVSSGSLAVDIRDIRVEDGRAAVELSHDVQGNLGTADMTTWLLWAEVDGDLRYTWTVLNPAMDSDVSER
ncbi:MAG: hypothetical protein E7436_03760 [Ruminococcaceae bacterium]|nr:hypothetical protein [Oscillospiraceae bacterium]